MKYSESKTATTRRSVLGKAALGISAAATGMLGAPAILAQQPRVIRMGYVMGAGGAADKAAGEFAKIVAERSKGALAVRNFPGGQLGGATWLSLSSSAPSKSASSAVFSPEILCLNGDSFSTPLT